MSYNRPSQWGRNNWGRGRGGGGFNRGGYGRGNRGFRGNQNYRGMQPYGNQGNYGGNWKQEGHGYGDRHSNQPWKKQKRETPGKRLSEQEIGVTEFIGEHSGFNGIIKSRYSDFQVSEINEEGQVAQLTDQTVPTPVDDVVDEDEDLLLTKYNVEILPMETWDSINKLVVSKEQCPEKVEIDVTGMTKEQRTKIHDAVKKAFGDSIVGSTVSVEEKKFVRFEKYRRGVRIDNRVKWIWPGEYVYFILHKENCDTMDAASLLADSLRMNMKASMLGYAGTKDRRAKTSQWVSVRRVDPRRIARAADYIRCLQVGNYAFKDKPLKLGMLQGNKFRIALRNVTAEEPVIAACCASLKERGFLNYYGLQRFGTRAHAPTYQVGVQLLKGNFKEAIDIILSEREGPLEKALRLFKRSGAAVALRACPPGAHHEAQILRGLARAPHDYLGALQRLPRNTRLLYMHSYQSLVWNRCVSERVKRFGLTPAVGDLVALADVDQEVVEYGDESDEEEASEKEDSTETTHTVKEEDKTPAEPPPADTPESKGKKKNNDQPKPKLPVKVLTQEDVDSGRYTIFDIIMPLPGYNIDYPPNMKEYYEEIMQKDGLTLKLKNKIKSYCMSGAYRRVAIRPIDVSWDTVRYNAPDDDLIPSDIDRLTGHQLPSAPDGKYKAVLLTMTLPASCYATMALRELLRVDTSGDTQAMQNNYHRSLSESDKSNNECEDKSTNESEDKSAIELDVKLEENETENGEKRKLETEGVEVEAKKTKTDDE